MNSGIILDSNTQKEDVRSWKMTQFADLKKDASFQSGLDDPIILDMIVKKKTTKKNRKTFASFAFRSFFSCGSVFFGENGTSKLLSTSAKKTNKFCWLLPFLGNDTVDRRNPANQLRLVVYPVIYKVL